MRNSIKDFTLNINKDAVGGNNIFIGGYASRFIDMYSFSFPDNTLLNKLMINLLKSVYEIFFTCSSKLPGKKIGGLKGINRNNFCLLKRMRTNSLFVKGFCFER